MSQQDLQPSQDLAQLVRDLNAAGHNPATSGNYSLRSLDLPGYALVSESGVDKSRFTIANLLPIQIATGEPHPSLAGQGRKSSDETALHLTIYQNSAAGSVLHSHHLDSLLFADLHPGQTSLTLTGLELLKGFQGVKTHETELQIPCLNNSQDMQILGAEVNKAMALHPAAWGFLLRGHGLYVWGNSLQDAKRHLEVFAYVFQYHVRNRR